MDICLDRNFEFILPGKLAGMSMPGAFHSIDEDLKFLKEKKIKAIITLTSESIDSSLLNEYEFEYLHLPVKEFGTPSLEQVEKFINFTDEMLSSNKAVVIHCFAGRGRTGLCLALYLVHCGKSADYAIKTIKEIRHGSFDNYNQEEFIYNYEILIRL